MSGRCRPVQLPDGRTAGQLSHIADAINGTLTAGRPVTNRTVYMWVQRAEQMGCPDPLPEADVAIIRQVMPGARAGQWFDLSEWVLWRVLYRDQRGARKGNTHALKHGRYARRSPAA